MTHDSELAAAIQAAMEYYTEYARYHRLWRYALAREDGLRTELAFTRMINARLAERVCILEEVISEMRFGPVKYPI